MKYPYEAVVDEITERIAAGVLKEGDKLPSVSELAAEKKIGRSTADKVYWALTERRLVHGRVGAARYVSVGAQELARKRLGR